MTITEGRDRIAAAVGNLLASVYTLAVRRISLCLIRSIATPPPPPHTGLMKQGAEGVAQGTAGGTSSLPVDVLHPRQLEVSPEIAVIADLWEYKITDSTVRRLYKVVASRFRRSAMVARSVYRVQFR